MGEKFIIPEIPPGEGFRDRLGDLPWDRFCTVSLANWYAAAIAAEVPRVPATQIWKGPVMDLLTALDDPTAPNATARSLYDTLTAAAAPLIMFRWDCCASYHIKHAMGTGRSEWSPEFLELPIDDPRAFDLLFEYPRAEIAVWKRPWVQAQIIGGYPLEFRVFVENSEIIGISSYYPQRPLPDTAEIRQAMSRIRIASEAIIRQIKTPVWVPPGGGADQGWAQDRVHGTLDWLVRPNGLGYLFLEGGPPYGAGAHPCCFLGRKVEGVALSCDIAPEDLY